LLSANHNVAKFLEPVRLLNEGRKKLLEKDFSAAFEEFFSGFNTSLSGHGETTRLLCEYAIMIGSYICLKEKTNKTASGSVFPNLKTLRAWILTMKYDSAFWVDNKDNFVKHCFKILNRELGKQLKFSYEIFDSIRSLDPDDINELEEYIKMFKIKLNQPNLMIDKYFYSLSQLSFCCRQARDHVSNKKFGPTHDERFSTYVKQLINAGADVNYRNEEGRGIFHELANGFNSRIDLVAFVFETNKVNIGQFVKPDRKGDSALEVIFRNIFMASKEHQNRLMNALSLYVELQIFVIKLREEIKKFDNLTEETQVAIKNKTKPYCWKSKIPYQYAFDRSTWY
jgi:hypothetical protein